MPKVDEDAKQWELALSGRFGKAVLDRRKALKLTAADVAEKTKTLRYPVTAVALSKIENNKRAGKLDVAEVMVLAAALSTSPIQLLFPDLVDVPVEMLPDRTVTAIQAIDWFCCDGGQPRPNPQTIWEEVENSDYSMQTGAISDARAVSTHRTLLQLTARLPAEARSAEQLSNVLMGLDEAKTRARRNGLVIDDKYDTQDRVLGPDGLAAARKELGMDPPDA